MPYLSQAVRDNVRGIIAQAGQRETADAPLAWLSMEPGLMILNEDVGRPLKAGFEVLTEGARAGLSASLRPHPLVA
jgi:hypothetical protein